MFTERLEQAIQQLDPMMIFHDIIKDNEVIRESLYLAPAIQQTTDWAIDMLNRGWNAIQVREALESQLDRLLELGRLKSDDVEVIRNELKMKLPSLFGK
jgi:hypothetical protein